MYNNNKNFNNITTVKVPIQFDTESSCYCHPSPVKNEESLATNGYIGEICHRKHINKVKSFRGSCQPPFLWSL